MNTIIAIKKEFAFYGFTCSPLTDKEIETTLQKNLTFDEIYGIGCDVSNGYAFDYSLELTLEDQQ